MIQEPNDTIAQGYTTLFESYISKLEGATQRYIKKLKADYTNASNPEKIVILGGLERAVSIVENVLTSSSSNNYLEYMVFGKEEARRVRKATKETQRSLAENIGANSNFQWMISGYETGRIKPNLKNPNAEKYLQWLAEKGYNPFNLRITSTK